MKVKSHPVINFPTYFLRARVESLLTLVARALTLHIYSLNRKTADGVKFSGPVAG